MNKHNIIVHIVLANRQKLASIIKDVKIHTKYLADLVKNSIHGDYSISKITTFGITREAEQ